MTPTPKTKALPKSPKLSWDDYFMRIAHTVKLRSSCSRRQVGSILVMDKRVISTGYNGTPKGVKNCDEGGCERCNSTEYPRGTNLDLCVCSHGEENAIVQAARHGVRTDGAVIYTTNSPCTGCCKMIINAGITKLVIDGEYPDKRGLALLKQAGVTIVQFGEKQ